jgi:hypothetical protein
MKKFLLLALLLVAPALADPPGHNVHLVFKKEQNTLWRGGGPTRETLLSLRDTAKELGHPVTLIDLRHPAFDDDWIPHAGRLTPAGEEKLAKELGLRYHSISALDKGLVHLIDEALVEGDVYIHCHYGVNRTGFAVGRYATARELEVDRSKMGERDWNQGVAFQKRLMGQ